MKYYQRPFTDNYPFQYTVESGKYIAHTCNEAHYIELQKQIAEKGIVEFTPMQISKLEGSSFTTFKKM
jgi:hypothetical protein